MRYILKTDASATLVSFVLTKEVDGRELIVDASSRSLNRAERNWSVLDKEFFSLVVAVRKNISLLQGRFTVVTDCRALCDWDKVEPLSGPTRRSRWAEELRELDFEVVFRGD